MLANALRNLFSFNRPPGPGVVRPVGGGDHPSPKSLTPDLIKKLEEGDEDALRYPPYIRGYPAFIGGHVLLDYHKEKVGQIASGIGLPPSQFNKLILPVLVSYANFVHLVPASQNHHHRAWGGLLAHGLEVALLALNSCQVTSFDHGRVPQERTRRKERWYAAAVFASLLHDTGKPLSDFRVTDATGERFWKPVSKSIPDWAAEHGIERYYLHWNPGRHERHKNLSITMVDRILHPEVREWLMDGGQDLYTAMVAAITGDDEKSALTGIVIKADSASVQLDLKKRGGDPAGTAAGGTGVPIASHVISAMRLLRQNGVWKANGKGDRIWSTTQGIFIAWNSAATEVVEKMLADGLKAFPRSADSLGEILADHDVFERNPNGSIYWKVAPDVLSEGKEKILRLQCIKLSSPSTLYPYDPLPPSVAVIIGDEKTAVRYDPANGAMGVPVGEGAQESQSQGIELAGAELPMQAGDEFKPMFDLEGGSPPASAPQPAGQNSKFSAPTLMSSPAPADNSKKAAAPAAPSLAPDTSAQKRPGLVIGAPPPPQPQVALGVTDSKQKPAAVGTDLFAGVKVGIDISALEDEVEPSAQKPTWDDPFAAPDAQLDGDPFAIKQSHTPQPKKEVVQPAAETSSLIDVAKGDSPRPNAPRQEVKSPKVQVIKQSPAPALQVGLESPAPHETNLVVPAFPPDVVEGISGEGFETIDITSDFDPEVLELTGIEKAFADVPVKAAVVADEDTSDSSGPAVIQPPLIPTLPKEPRGESTRTGGYTPLPPGAFEEAFRFDAEHSVLDEFDVPDLPIDNPLGISAPAEFADLDVSSFAVQEAPQSVSLEGYDLPTLDSNVFLGGIPSQPILQMGDLEDLECMDADDDHAGAEEVAHQAGVTSTDASPNAKKRRKRKKRKSGVIAPMPETNLGTPLIAGPVPGIQIGPVRKPTAQPALLPAEPGVPAVRSAENEKPVEQTFSEPLVGDYMAYLGRHPDLAEKFLWYTRNFDEGVRVFKRHQLLFLFREGGFMPGDEDALNEARWLWFDITAPGRLVFGVVGDKGVVLAPYLVDALAAICGAEFQVAISKPASSLTPDEMARLARTALEKVPVNTETYGVPVAVLTPRLISALVSDLGVRESDLIRALIETQQISLDRKNYVVSVEAKAVTYE
ncbi:MobH family relaxase [Pseudomonas aeruginosa]|nr:TraI domain-containing protein [Pseudomonas aeruginosa]